MHTYYLELAGTLEYAFRHNCKIITLTLNTIFVFSDANARRDMQNKIMIADVRIFWPKDGKNETGPDISSIHTVAQEAVFCWGGIRQAGILTGGGQWWLEWASSRFSLISQDGLRRRLSPGEGIVPKDVSSEDRLGPLSGRVSLA